MAGIIAHTGPIARYRHGRQLIKAAGTNPTRSETGERQGGRQAMSHRGRSGLRQVTYMATISCLGHNPRLRAHYDRLTSRPERHLRLTYHFGPTRIAWYLGRYHGFSNLHARGLQRSRAQRHQQAAYELP